jgi:hypothetical protein
MEEEDRMKVPDPVTRALLGSFLYYHVGTLVVPLWASPNVSWRATSLRIASLKFEVPAQL